jgi:lipopolysaccharide export system ATP-binding protein
MPHELRAENLSKTYHRRQVVNGVNLRVQQGEIVGLLGPNGAGKTTTFRMITGEVRADGGRVLFDDADITRVPMYKRARMGITYLPQESSAFRGLTTEQNLVAVLQMHKLRREQIRQRVNALLEEFGMESRRHIKAMQLSGGERRRMEVMRALALEPLFVFLDEPFAGLDPISISDLQQILLSIRGRSIGILISDHNVNDLLTITDRDYVVNEGRIVAEGTPVVIAADTFVRKIFLGQSFKLRGPDNREAPVPVTKPSQE